MKAHFRHLRYVMGENPVTFFSFVLFFLLMALGLFGPWVAPYDPLASDTANALQPPSWAHPFGTDSLGRDVFSRVITATRLDLAISVAAVSLSFVAGSVAGVCAGYFGGMTDKLIGRLTDTIMAFPLFVLAMGIVSALGNTIENIVYTTAVINFPFYARVADFFANDTDLSAHVARSADVSVRLDGGLARDVDVRVISGFHHHHGSVHTLPANNPVIHVLGNDVVALDHGKILLSGEKPGHENGDMTFQSRGGRRRR